MTTEEGLASEERIFRWWPRYRPGAMELGAGGPRLLLRTLTALFVVTGIVASPPIAKATGIAPAATLVLGAVYAACMALNDFVLHPAAMRSRAGFNAQMAITPLYNVVICALLVVLSGDPRSPLWMALLAFACFTAAWQEIDASYALLLLHTLTPVLTIPLFLRRGRDLGESLAGPLFCGAMSGMMYSGIASTSAAWRRIRAEQAATIEALQRRTAELERRRIARDLHDTLGSSLGLVGLYGELIERHAERPQELHRIARTLREAAHEGLDDLRGVLDALDPEATDLASVGATLQRVGDRAVAASGAAVRVTVSGEAARLLDGPERLALVRVFQESVNNALRHGRARSIDARLAALSGGVSLEIADDGSGFSPGSVEGGRGLAGMRARAAELGGALEVASSRDAGTTITLGLPAQRRKGAAA